MFHHMVLRGSADLGAAGSYRVLRLQGPGDAALCRAVSTAPLLPGRHPGAPGSTVARVQRELAHHCGRKVPRAALPAAAALPGCVVRVPTEGCVAECAAEHAAASRGSRTSEGLGCRRRREEQLRRTGLGDAAFAEQLWEHGAAERAVQAWGGASGCRCRCCWSRCGRGGFATGQHVIQAVCG
jgi:hypothetical protein